MNDIVRATQVVHTQFNRMKVLDRKFSSMEDYFKSQIAENIKSGNNARAKILATELSNVRRVRRTTQHMSLALEAMIIRFSTLNEFANVLDTINPTIETVRDIQSQLAKAIPTANAALSDVSSVTSDLLLNSNIRESAKVSTPVDADALSILNEIEGVLEEEAKMRLPEVPTTLPQIKGEQAVEEEQEQVMVEG